LCGRGVARDPAQALQALNRAAVQNEPAAHRVLGLLAEAGAGVPRDREAALAHYRAAAERGDPLAGAALARLAASPAGASPREVGAQLCTP
jgi:TPR repeat protein